MTNQIRSLLLERGYVVAQGHARLRHLLADLPDPDAGRLSPRMTLNILLSFAQFEREVIGERIRDKVAASRKRGIWMGGYVPLGYDVQDRKLVVNETEAASVRLIFERFVALGSATALARESS